MLKDLNRRFLLTPKLLYLSIELVYATLATFRYGFIVNGMGISPTNYSEMYGYCMLISFCTNILIAMAFDKINNPKLFFTAILIISGSVFQTICWFKGSISVIIFWILMFIYFTFNGSLIPLLDRHVLAMLPQLGGQVKDYGSQRMFGTLACPIASFLIETLLKINNGNEKYNFNNLKYYHITFLSIAIITVWFIMRKVIKDETINENKENKENEVSVNNRVSLLDLFSNFPYMYFITIIFINGISRQGMTLFFQNYRSSFLNLEPYDLSGLPRFLFVPLHYTFNNNPISTTDTIGTLTEITCYFNSRGITNLFGLYWPLVFGQMAAICRFLSYYFLSEKNSHRYLISCFIEVLRGINYGMTHVCGVQLVLYMCPKNLKGTSQMIYCGVIGLGGAVAGRIAKQLFDKNKMGRDEYEKFFLVNTTMNIICLTMIIIKYGIIERVLWYKREKEEEKTK